MRRASWFLFLTTLLLLPGPGAAAEGDTITIFHTNDLHAQFLPAPATWRDDRAPIGGFKALDEVLRRAREEAGPSIYLDAGDFMTGTPISDLPHGGAEGGAIVEFYNSLGLDAMTIGNHDCDKPRENLRRLIGLADFPLLGANVTDSTGALLTGEAYRIFDVGGVRVGVIGITTEQLGTLVSDPSYEGLRVTGGSEALRTLVPQIDRETDLIVVLSHQGIELDRQMAEDVEGIDMIVGGHSHTRLDRGETVNGVLIVQAGSKGAYLGRVDLVVKDDAIANANARLLPTWAEGALGSPGVQALVASYEERILTEYGVVIAQASERLGRCYYCESDLGNWITDGMRTITGADVALLNSGTIRKDVLDGPVTKLDIQEMLPFSNYLCTFRCTGEELIAIAAHNARAEAGETHGILQVSGLEYGWRTREGQIDAPIVLVNGLTVDPAGTYTVATADYVAVAQPEKYLGYVPEGVQLAGQTLTAAILTYVEETGRIDPPGKGRIRRVEIDYAPPR